MSNASDFFSVGGSGQFLTKFISGNRNIPAGSSGDILTLVPPSGQRVKLSSLGSVGSICTDMTLLIGGNVIIGPAGITFGGNTNTIGTFGINCDTYQNIARSSEAIVGGVNETLIIRRNSGNTNSAIVYYYEFGE